MDLSPVVLADAVVRLEPLAAAHASAMRTALAVDRSSFGLTTVPTPESVDGYIAAQLALAAAGNHQPFAQFDAKSGELIGHTAFANARDWPGRSVLMAVEVGHTWLVPGAQGRAFNSASKLLLFTHAFETLGARRVELKTDARNARSRAGIAAVGASFEGVLRSWQPSAVPGEMDRLRDTAMFSITADEWPRAKSALAARLAEKLRA
ncbi:GNAT family protein [Gryllotalpicola koreensis]|uniref:GNAT family protein n=1 Tax=Gryllotalpicola koreensis TaxID=993086 RepID=A0ABP7ZWM4_9MICO